MVNSFVFMNQNKHFLIFIAEILVLFELAAITWLCSGTRVPYMMVMVSISVMSFLCVVAYRTFAEKVGEISKTERCAYFLSFIFLAYVFIQSANIRVLKVPADGYSLYLEQKYCAYLPSCVYESFLDFNNSAYFALYLGLICFGFSCCYLFKSGLFAKKALIFFILNAVLMGVFAIWQKRNYSIMYDRFFSDGEFYGTFFLKNAAGAYFSLAIIAVLYLIFSSVKVVYRKILGRLLLIVLAILLSYNVYDSESEGAMLFCASVWGCFFMLFVLVFFAKHWGVKKLYIIVPLFLCITILAAFIFCSNKKYVIPSEIGVSMKSRIDINRYNISIFENSPICGIGTSGYDYELSKATKQNRDYSNVYKYLAVSDPHNSIFAYFIRHGVVGGLFISLALLLWISVCWKRRNFIHKENVFVWLGLGCCVMYSFIDMHLSSIPSTMFAFVFLLVLSTPINEEDLHESIL